MKQYLTHTDYALWEVIVNGDAPASIASVSGGVKAAIPLKTTKQKIARRNELNAKSTLLLSIPDEHLLKFHRINDAKTLWEAIKTIQLEIHNEVISQEDANLKLLRSLPPAWSTHTLIMRNKLDLDMLSMDDLYNNLKVYEAQIKGQSSSSSNSQNVAFVSSDNTRSTNEVVNTAHDVSAASSQGQAFASTYADDVMFSFFTNQSNSSQLDNEDLKQIDTDDLEEMDLKWQVAMLTMRVKRFIKKTGRNLNFNGKETIGFDKTNVECYNYHRIGQFARECRAPMSQGNKNRDNTRRVVLVETLANTLVVTDGMGYDWSYQAEKGPTDFSLMAFSSSGSSNLDNKSEILNKANLEIITYQLGLESLETRIVVHQKNEAIFEEDVAFLKYDIKISNNSITELKNQLEESLKEKDDLKLKIEKFETSSKNLTNLINSQISPKDKTGLGYNSHLNKRDLNNKSDVFKSTSDSSVNESEEDNNQATYTFKAGEGYHAVPLPYTGNFMPSRPDLSFAWLDDFVFKSAICETITSVHETETSACKTSKVSVNTANQSSLRAAASTSTARYINTAATRPTVNGVKPSLNVFHKLYSPVRLTYNQRTAPKNIDLKETIDIAKVNNVITGGTKAVVSAIQGNGKNTIKSSACWIWRPTRNVIDHISKESGSYMLKRFNYIWALVDGKKIIITEASIRRDLRLDDAEGTTCLPNDAIFEELARMGYEKPWIFVNPSLTKKVFANMKRVGTSFSERKETEVPHTEPQTKEHIPTPSHDPLPSGEDRMQLSELMEICTKLSYMVLSLEQINTNQAAEIKKLKKRVKKLEGKKKKITHGLKKLYKVGLSARVESSEEEKDQGRINDEDLFGVNDLDGDEVIVDVTAGENVEQDATVAKKEFSTLIEIKAAKPRAREVIVQEPSEFRTMLSLQPSQLPQAKDKGKGIMVEPEKPLNKKDQITFDEEVARKLDAQMKAEMKEEERIAKEKDEANRAVIKEWDDVQAKIDVDGQLAEQLQAQEREHLSIEERSKLLAKLIESKRKAGDEIEQESAKRQRLEKEDDTAELKRGLEIVPEDDDVIIEATLMSFKSPTIVDYKIYKEWKKSYFKIIKADGNSQNYLNFGTMFNNFNKEDLEVLRSIVKKDLRSSRVTTADRVSTAGWIKNEMA
nr:hypothetical protein [Tanacetum cinerariifolium]